MRLTRIPLAVRALVVLALLGAIAWQGVEASADRRDDDRLQEAVAMARAQVLDITTLDSDSVGAKLKAMAARTSGDFQDQVTSIAATFIEIVREKKVVATGRIDGVGVASSSDRDVSVLVASTAVVTESGKATSTTRSYRIKVSLVRAKDSWKINGMEFVQ